MKRILLLIPIILLLAGCIRGDVMADYHITNLAELQAMFPLHLADDCILDNDLDATGVAFISVGTNAQRFTGSFDGQGHVITGLTISQPALRYVGLFGRINSAGEIKDIELRDCDVTGKRSVGALAGLIDGGMDLTNCQASGIVNAVTQADFIRYIGGLVGESLGDSDVNSCNFVGNVVLGNATGGLNDIHEIGGLMGRYEVGEMDDCYAIVNISTGSAANRHRLIGGFIGYCSLNASISRSFARGNITLGAAGGNKEEIGGFIGRNNTPSISDCYARVDLSVGNAGGNANRLGGFIGYNMVNSPVSDSYSTGSINLGTIIGATTNVGGLIGDNDSLATTTNCFWDTETSGQAISDGGTGRTTAQMNAQSTFTDAGWDFDTIWSICDPPTPVYPWLQWQNIQCLGVIISLIG